MKLKKNIRKKICTSLLISGILGGVTNTTVLALDNSNTTTPTSEVSMMSKEQSQKIINQLSKTRSVIKECKVNNTNYILVKYGGKLYLFNGTTNQLVTGLVDVNGDTYYFSPKDGTAQKGWYNVIDSNSSRNGRYYFRDDTYTAYRNEFQTINHERFHFDKYGRIETGLFNVNGKTYYGKNKTGVIVTGWQKINGKRYYFDPMFNGMAKTGWYEDGSAGKMYFNNDGSMASGVNIIDGQTYLLRPHGKGENCYITNGFYTDNSTGKRYLFDGPHGEAHKGWFQNPYSVNNDAKGWMYFDKSTGVMANGWTTIDGKKYLFQNSTGSYDYYPKIGWHNDGYLGYGNTYYFDPDNRGAAVTSAYKVIEGKEYWFDSEGILKYNGGKHPTA